MAIKNKIFIVFCFFVALSVVQADDLENTNTNPDNPSDTQIAAPIIIKAEAGEDKNAAIGRTVAFDASSSITPPNAKISYHWDFGDGTTADSIDASHVYEKADTYFVSLTVSDGQQESKDYLLVSVEEVVMLLITDDSISDSQIQELNNYAHNYDVLLVNIKNNKKQESDYLTAQKIAQKLLTSPEDIKQSTFILMWTNNNIGLNTLSEFARIMKSTQESSSQTDVENSWQQKIIIDISKNTAGTSRLAQNAYDILKPKYIVITDEEAVRTLIANPNPDHVISTLNSNNAKYQIISAHSERVTEKITPFNFLSFLLNFLINKGVSQNTIYLILILPVVATIISFARQIVGLKAFGIYVPTIIALVFLETNIKWGLFIFIILLMSATIARLIAKKLKILYMPRMAIVLTAVSLTIFAVYVASGYLNKTGLFTLSIFPVIVLIILMEKFIEAQIEQGIKTAIILTLETLMLSIVSFYLASLESFRTLLLAYPELVLLTIIFNILLGRFAGLRFLEYFRFRKLLKNADQLQKQK